MGVTVRDKARRRDGPDARRRWRLGARQRAVALWSALAALVGPSAPHLAHAYKRASVDGKPTTYLYWSKRTITYWVNDKGCADVPLKDTMGAIKRSFFAWAGQSCTDLFFNYGGRARTTKSNMSLGKGEKPDFKNMVIWREKAWPPAGVRDGSINKDMVALTTLIYDTDTGEIVDADIDLNGFDYFWTATNDKTKAATDIQNAVTHEVGHLIGLAHSEKSSATMYGETPQGDMSKRDLDKDDIAALCFIYPFSNHSPTGPGQKLPTNDVHGGCELGSATGGDRPDHAALLLLLLGGLLVVRRNGRARRRRP